MGNPRGISQKRQLCSKSVSGWKRVQEKAGTSPASTVQAFAHPHAQTLASSTQASKLSLVQWQMTQKTHVLVQFCVVFSFVLIFIFR